ncbi:MAG: hypothetical protein ABJE95_01850 [Byssovorax sp.]
MAALRTTLAIAAFSIGIAASSASLAAAPPEATPPGIHPTLLWTALQLVPSPEWMGDGAGSHAGMRWQVTPLLYSFGINRKLSPWRSLIAEPVVRHAGSVELFLSPEYLSNSGTFAEHWLFRGGLRSYFPLVSKGEYLSTSLGASLLHFDHRLGAAASAGIYVLYGFVGAEVTYCPTPGLRGATATLSLRVF